MSIAEFRFNQKWYLKCHHKVGCEVTLFGMIVFGEGLLQWISGSTSKLAIGYDDVSDAYKISC